MPSRSPSAPPARRAASPAFGPGATTMAVAALVAACAFVGAACSVRHDGLSTRGQAGDGGGDRPIDGPGGDGLDSGPPPDTVTPPERGGGPPMPPDIAGCADGTREGFLDVIAWPDIAACAGGWSVPGLVVADGLVPHCGRQGGNSGSRADGDGCGAADLCAEGWRVCRRTEDIARRSPQGCEGGSLGPEKQFFAAALAAAPSGVCVPDPPGQNNLHGCGNIGAASDESCAPLNAVLDFSMCASLGVWSCGSTESWLREAAVVVKKGSDLGGVLCCRE